jgi:hypothetical protein
MNIQRELIEISFKNLLLEILISDIIPVNALPILDSIPIFGENRISAI